MVGIQFDVSSSAPSAAKLAIVDELLKMLPNQIIDDSEIDAK